MRDYERASHELALLIRRVMARFQALEASPRQYGTGARIFPSEMYLLEAVGGDPGVNVTRLAEHLSITKGAVSQTLSKLRRKGLVRQLAAAGNAKEVCIALTPKGRAAYRNAMKLYEAGYRLSERLYGRGFHNQVRRFMEVFRDLDRFLEELSKSYPREAASGAGR